MSKRKPPLDEQALEYFRRMGRKGGLKGGSKGGKRSLETMTRAERKERARTAGLAGGGRPRVVDRAKVLKLRKAGKPLKEIAAELDTSISTISRVLRESKE